MFERLVIATDLSRSSDEVVGCLGPLAKIGASEVELVHCLGLRHLDILQYELRQYVIPRLAEQQAAIEAQGFKVRIRVMPGASMHEINRVAAELPNSLIVVGSHGATALPDTLLGGVALSILENAMAPVLVVRLRPGKHPGQPCELTCRDFFRDILFPTDFSDTAERAFGVLEGLAPQARTISLLHVQDKTRIGPRQEHLLAEFNRIDQARMDGLSARLGSLETDVSIEMSYGSPIEEILSRAECGKHSLVVMGSQGRGFIARVFLGSVSHAVVRQAPIPVLLIPAVR